MIPALQELGQELGRHGRSIQLRWSDEVGDNDNAFVEATILAGERPEYRWRLIVKVTSPHHTALPKETGGYDPHTGTIIDGLVRDTFEPVSLYSQVKNLLKTDIIWDVLTDYARHLRMVST